MTDVSDLRCKLDALHRGTYSVEEYCSNRVVPDEVSSLRAVTDFSQLGLSDNLFRAICRMGFSKPSCIQEAALPLLLKDPPVNMMAQAQSGTGKTAAFLLAALTRVRPQDHWPQVIVMLPTLELAEQIATECKRMLANSPDVAIRHAVRGQLLSRNQLIKEHIVIGTPGKMLDWTLRYRLFDMRRIRVFVLDEADVMLAESGHYSSVINIHRQLDPTHCQMLLFSATFSKQVTDLADAIINMPLVKLTLRPDELALSNVRHFYMETWNEADKLEAISNLYESLSIGQCMVFCRSRATADIVAVLMAELGQNVAQLHGDLEPSERLAMIENFRNGLQKVMVTTNVCSRGIDIIQVSLVINFDMPLLQNGVVDCETYYHRVGRSGRFGRPGTAVNFIHPKSVKDRNALDAVRNEFGIDITLVDFRDHDQIVELIQYTEGNANDRHV
ncbi:ATP-dependent RNA helicase DDX19A-like [Tropilaelaps mercedesae]|uniref:RNA helicase n=1 Tax=Tropilaelaps mercedesae TaxID=418985 RepID=A0A1V9X5H6_9ACAR|nr:ATP-dependent RNA helicase DDX19A-like [Tropilaelaps mercedesae]